ncbi:MAG: FecR domain-containing protein [Gammaproteobacteria bacterium]|nr:FecR domain-containing protein [Gammaproteobacteria bacterium]
MALRARLPLLTAVRRGLRCTACVVLVASLAPALATAAPAGRTVFAKGAVTAESRDGAVQVIGKGSEVNAGDVVTTGARSFAVIELADGSRMALRPGTIFKVESFDADPGKESAIMRLFKGGLRTVTGYISKRNPEAYKLRTAVATIGIRGTEFDARLCDADCRAEAERLAPAAAVESRVVGRVAFLRGTLSGTGADGKTRAMVAGAPLYEGDTVRTGAGDSAAVLAFRDETRVTLSAQTDFAIEAARFGAADPAEGSAVFRLLRGGLRAVTGLIGQRDRNAMRFKTTVATIGIRGTGFDLLCQGSCGAGPGANAAEYLPPSQRWLGWLLQLIPAAYAQSVDGLFAQVWKGAIVLEFGAGREQLINEGQVGFLDALGSRFNFVPRLPVEFTAPRPDQVPVDQQRLFNVREKSEVDPGLYVSCYAGHCSMQTDTETVDLGAGEAAYTGGEGAAPERIEPPAVLAQDPYFKTVDPNMEPLLDSLGGESGEGAECDF